MYLILPYLIPPLVASQLRAFLETAQFVDGIGTVGVSAVRRKRNLELPSPSRTVPAALWRALMDAIKRDERLARWALPRRSTEFILNRHEPGMHYGDHIDDAIGLVDKSFIRVDLAMTVFLSPVEDYDGGELVFSADAQPTRIKLPPGHAVVYQAGTLHRVEEVTRGVRLAAVTWLESLVRNHEQRQILFDLKTSVLEVSAETQPDLRMRLEKSYTNLLRMWSEV